MKFSVKHGPVTILSVTQTVDGKLKLLAAQGESIAGPRLQIDNTNSRLKFSLPPAQFIDAWCGQGPTHHVALGIGYEIGALKKFARLAGLEFKEIG